VGACDEARSPPDGSWGCRGVRLPNMEGPAEPGLARWDVARGGLSIDEPAPSGP